MLKDFICDGLGDGPINTAYWEPGDIRAWTSHDGWRMEMMWLLDGAYCVSARKGTFCVERTGLNLDTISDEVFDEIEYYNDAGEIVI